MAGFIDWEALSAEYDRVHVSPTGGAGKLMVDAPAADAVEVVRCKDCIYNMPDIFDEKSVICERHGFAKFPRGGFCSYGEREKENEIE